MIRSFPGTTLKLRRAGLYGPALRRSCVVLVLAAALGAACSDAGPKAPAFCVDYGSLIGDLDRIYDGEASGATAAGVLGDIDQALADSAGLRIAGRFTAELDGLDAALTSMRAALASVEASAPPATWAPLVRDAQVEMDRSAVALDAVAAAPCVVDS